MDTDLWVEALSVGVESLDLAHRQQLGVICRVEKALAGGNRREALQFLGVLFDLFAQQHAEEMDIALRVRYPETDYIREVQDLCVASLLSLEVRVERDGDLDAACRDARALRLALVDFLLKGDVDFAPHMESAGFSTH